MAENTTKLTFVAEDRTAAAFRSIESSMKGLESSFGRLSGLMAGFAGGAMVAAFGAMIRASEDAAVAQRKLDAVIRATGNTSGYTAEQLSKLSDQLARTSSFDDEGFREATATLLRFGNIGGQNLERVLKLSADYAALTGGDLVSAAEKMGRALNNPAEGLKKLEKNFGDLGPEIERAIKAEMEMGHSSEALGLAIDALEKKIGGADQATNAGLTGSLKQLRKAFGELMESFGSVADSSPVVGVIDKTAAALRGLKEVVDGPWVLKAAALLSIINGRGFELLQGLGNMKPDTVSPAGSGGSRTPDYDQDAAGMKYLDRVLAERKRAYEQWLKEEERLRQLGLKGEEAALQAEHDMLEDQMKQESDIRLRAMRDRDEIRRMDLEGQEWLARNVVEITQREADQRLAIEERLAEQIRRIAEQNYLRMWDEIATRGAEFFTDLVLHGRDAFKRLGEQLKQFAAELIALFAKRWILQMAAGVTGNASLAAAAQSAGQGTLAGSFIGNGATASTGIGSAIYAGGSEFFAGMTGSFMGPAAPGSMASMGAEFAAFMTNPVTLAVMAVVAIAVAARARAGGPKEGGAYYGSYDASGSLVGDVTAGNRRMTPTGGDPLMREAGQAIAQGYFATLTRWGGSTSGITFGGEFDKDPRGSADNRVIGRVIGADGNPIFDQMITAGRDDADFERATGLMARRQILAALQNSTLPEGIQAILGLVDAASASAEDIDGILAMADAFDKLLEALAPINAQDVIAQAAQDATAAFGAQGEALLALANSSSLTTQSLEALAQAAGGFRQAAVQLIAQLEQVKKSLRALFADTYEQIFLSGMDPSQQYAYWQSQAEGARAQLATATDPAEIDRLGQIINRAIGQAWGLLDAGQQSSLRGQFLAGITDVSNFVTSRIGTVQERTAAAANAVLTQVETIMTTAAASMNTAGDKMGVAADKMLVAASEPVKVTFDPGTKRVVNGG